MRIVSVIICGFVAEDLSANLQTLIQTRSLLLTHPSLVVIGGMVLQPRKEKLGSSLGTTFRKWNKVRRVASICFDRLLLTVTDQMQFMQRHCTPTRVRTRTSLRLMKATLLPSSTALKRIGGKLNVTVSCSSCLPHTWM